MSFQLNKYIPPDDLQPYLRFYYTAWLDRGTLEIALDNHPQGTIDIVFVMKGLVAFGGSRSNESLVKEVLFVGQQEEKFTFRFHPDVRILGVNFTPEGFSKIFRVPVNELTNTGVEGGELLEKDDRFVMERIAEQRDDQDRFAIPDSWFMHRIYANDVSFDAVDYAIATLRRGAGQASIKDLAEAANMRVRSLQRKFAARIGVSPKTFARIMRFNSMLRLLKPQQADDKVNWLDLLYQSGYYDQMHFIKEFKQFTGKTPTEYLEIDTDLADFFLGE